ncbi:MAG: hypothetical protein J3R72DRAFT_508785 [Linnemannia gamsii]|nr:MAG: hypothetical protein J3R72DRAFT_508785 [Linnemannia gamsii]
MKVKFHNRVDLRTLTMAHLTPLALHFSGPTPININEITLDCGDFFKTKSPSKWLAEKRKIVLESNNQTRAKLNSQAVPTASSGSIPNKYPVSNPGRSTKALTNAQIPQRIIDPALSFAALGSLFVCSRYLIESVQVGQKHFRDTFEDVGAILPKTPRNKSPFPAPIPTESLDSPPEVNTFEQQRNPFLACEEVVKVKEEEGSTTTDGGEKNDVHRPDNMDQAYQFTAMLEGIDIAIGFQTLFTAVKKKTIYFYDIDQALSGVILLNKEGSMVQKLHFGEKTIDKMREKA